MKSGNMSAKSFPGLMLYAKGDGVAEGLKQALKPDILNLNCFSPANLGVTLNN